MANAHQEEKRPVRSSQATPVPSIRIEDLSFDFSGTPVFSRLNLTVEKGLCTCILGPSGCGKSTLLRLISGSAGLAYTGNILFDDAPGRSGNIAWMAQKDLLLPWMNVMDNILLGARLRGSITRKKRKKAIEMLEAAGLPGCQDKRPAELSGGMRQRVALLRTLMEERPVILMDEPFSALDALNRVKLQNLAVDLVHGATVLLVTHDPMEALRIGDRIFVLSGKPAQTGDLIVPPGAKPRNSSDAGIATLNASLLEQLLSAEEP